MRKTVLLFTYLLTALQLLAEDGYRLWLRYDKIPDPHLLKQYRTSIGSILFPATTPVLKTAKKELLEGLQGLLDKRFPETRTTERLLAAGTPVSSDLIQIFFTQTELSLLGQEGYMISSKKLGNKTVLAIAANTDIGVLYGVFHFLRLLQSHQTLQKLSITNIPAIKIRMLNHWDNLNRTVERGYAGFSIWNWHTLPDYIDQRYIDYARANASIGINGTVLTNVNANAIVLTKPWLEKVKALADLFRPYGIKVYLTARFSAPIELGKLKSA